MTTEYHFAGLILKIPSPWNDISLDLPPNSPPTLAREDGVGVIQFTTSEYRSGELPDFGPDELRNMFETFCSANGIPKVHVHIKSYDQILYASGVSITNNEIVSVWCITDGRNISIATYTNLEPKNPSAIAELAEAEIIVKSAKFELNS